MLVVPRAAPGWITVLFRLPLQGGEYGQVDLVGYRSVYVLHAMVLVEVLEGPLPRTLGGVTLFLDGATGDDVIAYVLEHWLSPGWIRSQPYDLNAIRARTAFLDEYRFECPDR